MKKFLLFLFVCIFFTSFHYNDISKDDVFLIYYKYSSSDFLDSNYNQIISEDISKFVLYYNNKLSVSKEIIKEIIIKSIEYDVPINLSLAVANKESFFKIRAVNYNLDKSGNIKSVDRGVFQLNSLSFPQLTESDFFNYKINIDHGIKYLKYCIDSFSSYSQAVSAYNGGHYRVCNNTDVFETVTYNYVSDVINFYASLDKDLLIFLKDHND